MFSPTNLGEVPPLGLPRRYKSGLVCFGLAWFGQTSTGISVPKKTRWQPDTGGGMQLISRSSNEPEKCFIAVLIAATAVS